jgi:CBS domain containing-hemolysin-like protein
MEPGARRLLDRVFDYTRRVARHVMTLRQDVIVLQAGRSFDENLQAAMLNQFTRYPLVDPATDQVLGYVHVKDITAALAMNRRPDRMRDIAREPIYVTEDTPLESLRREFQRRGVHLAIVRDPNKKFVGIVTLEDLIEEFVGEIRDEQDVGEVPPILPKEDGGFEADGRLTLDVAAREFGLELPDAPGNVETLGRYVRMKLRDAPKPGDSVEAGGFRLVVIEVREDRIRRLRGEPIHPEEAKNPIPLADE